LTPLHKDLAARPSPHQPHHTTHGKMAEELQQDGICRYLKDLVSDNICHPHNKTDVETGVL
jgi:hypothetical protein